MVHSIDQLDDHAEGLRAHVEMDWELLPFCLRVPCSKIVVPRTTGWPDSSIF